MKQSPVILQGHAVQDARMPRGAGRRRSGRFLLCVLTISPGESGRYLVAPGGRGPGMVRVKKVTDGLFQQPARDPGDGFSRLFNQVPAVLSNAVPAPRIAFADG